MIMFVPSLGLGLVLVAGVGVFGWRMERSQRSEKSANRLIFQEATDLGDAKNGTGEQMAED